MLSYQARRNLFGTLANNTATATLTLADTLINIEDKRILSSRQWSFLEKQFFMNSADTVTMTIASPAIFTCTTYDFSINDIVYFTTTGALPTGITASTPYYVISAGQSGNAFEVSATLGGTAVVTTGTQSGTHTIVTTFKSMPQYVDRLSTPYVTVGSYNYTPRECPDRATWDRLNLVTIASDIPLWWYTFDGKFGLFPRPASKNLITLNSKRLQKDLTVADYTTGTITTTAGNIITGSGTTWTSQMAGRWLQIGDGNAVGLGDGYWYKILSVASTTSLVLEKAYAGTAIATGSATYTIAQVSNLPEQYQDLPIYGALRTYYTSVDPDESKATLYGGMYTAMYQTMEEDYTVKNQSCVIDSGENRYVMENPNNYITL